MGNKIHWSAIVSNPATTVLLIIKTEKKQRFVHTIF